MGNEWLFVVVPVVLFLTGVAMIWFGHRTRARAKASAGWPKVTGTVTAARVEHRRRSKGGSRFVPTLQYTYDVGGQRHTGTRLAFADTERVTEAAAQQVIAPYPVGGAVAVFYDPADPSVSTLSASMEGTMILVLMGWFFAIISLLIGLFFWAMTR